MNPEGLVRRVRGEYNEMPGLGLTIAQASRLWHVDAATCQAVLSRLVSEDFLYRTRDGRYVASNITMRAADPRALPVLRREGCQRRATIGARPST